ncbi:MAG TPA: neutral zinc metallopeptidase [Gemmatimonadaceae bacterium]|nr:neutral zinc metallopeptidase [Gemmatimonadaceae bacterium]
MRWTPGGESSNIEDRRGQGGGFIPGGRAGMGIGGAVIMLVLSLIFGRDFVTGGTTTDSTGAAPAVANGEVASSPSEERLVQFVSFVLDDVQNTWRSILADRHVPYQDAKLVLFRDMTQSGCGTAESTMGPFYCPLDQKVYIDLGFYDELQRRFGAPGDFAQAYVLAHELGHHVQHLLGIDAQSRRLQRANPGSENAVSVRLELQADCFAGIWGHTTEQRRLLSEGDIDEGLNAAAAVGDDRLQRAATGRVNTESFTHGSAAQRSAWFKRGFTTGQIEACDTFGDRGP